MNIKFLDATVAAIYRSFGTAVSMSYDGSRVAVGDRFGETFYVFERDTEENFTKAEWKVLGDAIPPFQKHVVDDFDEIRLSQADGQADVALSGDGGVVACGYPYYRTDEDGNGKYEKWGAVVVLALQEGQWKQRGEPIYGEGDRDYIGQALALSEDGTVVAFGEYRYSRRTGRVTVRKWTGTEWTTIGIIPGETRGEQFGGEVSLSRDGTIVAASAQYNGDGLVRVFQYIGDTGDLTSDWAQMGSNIVGREGHPFFGWPVSLSGDGTRLATASASFGSDGDVDGGQDKGTVWVFEYNATEPEWYLLGDPVDGDNGGDGLGWGLALSADGTTFAAGAPNSDKYFLEGGHVKIYRYHCGNWTQMGRDIEGTEADGWTGLTVSLSESGEYLAAGSPSDYSAEIGKPGSVRMYEAPFDFDYIKERTNKYGMAIDDDM